MNRTVTLGIVAALGLIATSVNAAPSAPREETATTAISIDVLGHMGDSDSTLAPMYPVTIHPDTGSGIARVAFNGQRTIVHYSTISSRSGLEVRDVANRDGSGRPFLDFNSQDAGIPPTLYVWVASRGEERLWVIHFEHCNGGLSIWAGAPHTKRPEGWKRVSF